jgi:hypothetical protein
MSISIAAGLLFALMTAAKAKPYPDSPYLHGLGRRHEPFMARTYSCMRQCIELFGPAVDSWSSNPRPKNCTAEANDLDLANCVCDHLLIRTKLPQCYISTCGEMDDSCIIPYLNRLVSFPEDQLAVASIGLWGACSQRKLRQDLRFSNVSYVVQGRDYSFSFQGWEPMSSNEELGSLLQARASDNRLVLPSWLRQYFHPIWRQDNLLSSLGYRPPLDSENVGNPRSVVDLLDYRIAFSVHFFATVAYAHLLHTVSESEGNWIEAVQVIIFIILPTLPTIQLVNSFLKVILKSAWSAGFRYNISALCGQQLFERRETSKYRSRLIDLSTNELKSEKQSYRSAQFWGRFGAILVNFYLVTARFAAYVRRLRSTIPGAGHTAIYLAATGFDHRLGWVSFGGLISTVITLLRHIVNVEWSMAPNLHLPRRSTFDWKMEVWLEIIAAALGQSMLMRLTNRMTAGILWSRIFSFDSGRYVATVFTLLALLCVLYREPILAGIRRRSS